MRTLFRWFRQIRSEWTGETRVESSEEVKVLKAKIADLSETIVAYAQTNDRLLKEQQSLILKHMAELQELSVKHKADLAKQSERVKPILAMAYDIQWFRNHHQSEIYELHVALDARAMGLFQDQEHRKYLGKDVAYQIEAQIVSTQFVRMADDPRRRPFGKESNANDPRYRIPGL